MYCVVQDVRIFNAGLNVTEVAHDYQPSHDFSLNATNSYDTWPGKI